VSQRFGLEVEQHEALEQVVVEDKVKVIIFGLGADALLARDEGKALSKFQQEGLEIADECVFERRLKELSSTGQPQELQHDGIMDEVARCGLDLGELLNAFISHRLAVLAGEEPFIVEGADLAVEGAGVPVLGGGLVHIPLASSRGIHAEENAVVGPAQFGTQCVPIRECRVEGPHVSEITLVEALAKLGGELGGNVCQHRLAIRRAGLAALLRLNDMPTDNPAGAHLHNIHSGDGLPTSFQDDSTQIGEQADSSYLRFLRRMVHHRRDCWNRRYRRFLSGFLFDPVAHLRF